MKKYDRKKRKVIGSWVSRERRTNFETLAEEYKNDPYNHYKNKQMHKKKSGATGSIRRSKAACVGPIFFLDGEKKWGENGVESKSSKNL